jgi:hypothetical protein
MDSLNIQNKVVNSLDLAKALSKAKINLDNLHKNVQDMTTSIDRIVIHFPNLDLTELKDAIKAKEDEFASASKFYESLEQERKEKVKEIKDTIRDLFTQYTDLDNLGINKQEEGDEFVVKMAKFLYPNQNDNHQLRGDPPISNVVKREWLMESPPSSSIPFGESNIQGFTPQQYAIFSETFVDEPN